jgi:hypothetical protein
MRVVLGNPDIDLCAAEINVSRKYPPEAWAEIDRIENEEMMRANCDGQ